eukprot:2436096-Heterocapsa_arctica.AAC.1
MQKLGWKDNTPTNITDRNNQTRGLGEWHDFFDYGIKRARQQAWEKSDTKTHQITKEWKEQRMKLLHASAIRSLFKKIRRKLEHIIPFLQMESGQPEEHTREKIKEMETASFVEKRTLELTICGGIAEHSTNPRILVISNLRKPDTKSTTNL